MPNGMAGTNRIKCYARALLNAGIPCEILVFSRDSFSDSADGMIEGVPYHYVFSFKKRWIGRLGSIQTVIMMVGLYIYLLTRLQKKDVVIEYARESYKFIKTIIKLVHFKKSSFVSELCEVPGLGFQHEAARREREYITKKLFPHFDGVIAISDYLVEYAKQNASANCRIIKIPVLVDAEEFLIDGKRPVKEPYIFYSGSYEDQKDGTIGMFDAFCQISKKYDKPLKFVCTGNKKDFLNTGYLNEFINDEDLSNRLIFTGYLSHDRIINYLSHCEMVVSARFTNEQTQNGFSTKLAEYAASGKALILTPVGEAAHWFHDGIDCYMVPERNVEKLADGIVYLLNNQVLRVRLGSGLRNMCQKSFDYRAWSAPLKEFIKSVTA